MSKFVYITQDFTYDNGQKTINQYEIGILKEESPSTYSVTFAKSNITLDVDKSLISFFDPKETGDLFQKKVCNVCNRLLDVELFQKNQNAVNNRPVKRPSCNHCRKIIDGVNLSSAGKKQLDNVKPHMEIWTCPICKKTTIPGLTSKVVRDHNHNTGKPRAWICDSCNTGLGRFKDDISLLESAIDYLKSFEE